MSDEKPTDIQPLELGTIYPTKKAFLASVKQYEKSEGVDVKVHRSKYTDATQEEYEEVLYFCDTATATPLNWENRKKKRCSNKKPKNPDKNK